MQKSRMFLRLSRHDQHERVNFKFSARELGTRENEDDTNASHNSTRQNQQGEKISALSFPVHLTSNCAMNIVHIYHYIYYGQIIFLKNSFGGRLPCFYPLFSSTFLVFSVLHTSQRYFHIGRPFSHFTILPSPFVPPFAHCPY